MKKETVNAFIHVLVSHHEELVTNGNYSKSIDGENEKKVFDALINEGYEEEANDIKEFFELYDNYHSSDERFKELNDKYDLGFD